MNTNSEQAITGIRPLREELLRIAGDFLRFFTASKTLQSRTINRLGGQQLRMLLARAMHRLRRARSSRAYREQIQTLRRDGMLIWPQFMPADTFAQLAQEATALLDSPAERRTQAMGTTTLEQITITDEHRRRSTTLAKLLDEPRIAAVLSAIERRPPKSLHGLRAVERVTFGANPESDPESELHTDIFFHTHKAWLYLDDVQIEHGPLVVAPGSHRLDSKRLKWEYRESVSRNRGSRRIGAAEMADRGLQEKPICVPANTLVVANTHGYHRRHEGVDGATRRAIQMTFRYQPFIPDAVYRRSRSKPGHA